MLLGLDIGTSRTKAVLMDAGGREVGAATVTTPFTTTDGRVEMPVDALLACLRDVLAALGDRRRHVVAVGVAGIAESGAPLDPAGRPLAPVIAWHDERGAEAVAHLEREFGADLALRNGQPPNTKMTAAKLGWLVAHGLHGMDRWLGVPELALRALAGAEATEHSLAARTGCYDVVARRWMPEVAGALGFSTDAFAPVQAAGSVMGRVSADGAGWSGLPEGLPVTIAGHDHLAGMAGAGAGPDDVANSVGTAETVAGRTATAPDMAAAVANRAAVSVYPGGTEWAVMVERGAGRAAHRRRRGRARPVAGGARRAGAGRRRRRRPPVGGRPRRPDGAHRRRLRPADRRARAAPARRGVRRRQRQRTVAAGQGRRAPGPRRAVDRDVGGGKGRRRARRRGRRLVAVGGRRRQAASVGSLTPPSAPTVVTPPWPGRTTVSAGSVSTDRDKEGLDLLCTLPSSAGTTSGSPSSPAGTCCCRRSGTGWRSSSGCRGSRSARPRRP